MEGNEETAVVARAQPLTAVQVQAQVRLIQEVMASVMKDGHHYGKIPGCGDKPALFKAGAEKLLMTFRLASNPQVEEMPTDDGLTFRVTCVITNQKTGEYLGSGIGEASTNEEKYKWRKAVCDEEFNETPEDRRREKWFKGRGNPYKVKQVRTNPADVANTVLKMSKKRAQVDAALTVTAASDIFEQDLEDMPEGTRQEQGTPPPSKTSSVKPAVGKIDEPKSKGKGKPWEELQGELLAYCKGDEGRAAEVLKEITLFEKDGKEIYVRFEKLSGTSDKWAAKALKKLRAMAPEAPEAEAAPAEDLPPGCTKDPSTCGKASFGEGDAVFCGPGMCAFPKGTA